MSAQVAAVRAAFEGEVALLYASKANGHPDVLATLEPLVDGVDVTSAGALRAAREAGFAGAAVQWTSPGKSRDDLALAVRTGATVVLGGVDEAEDLVDVARAVGGGDGDVGALPVTVRVNPKERIHAFRSVTGGVPSPFGIPEEELGEALARMRDLGLRPRGIHVHRGSQCTSASAWLRHGTSTLDLLDRLVREEGLPPWANLGGGLGVAVEGEQLDLASLGRRMAAAVRRFRQAHPQAAFTIEPGRYLVSEAGTLWLTVLRRREVRGTVFLVLDGGIDVFLFATERMRHGAPPPMEVVRAGASRWAEVAGRAEAAEERSRGGVSPNDPGPTELVTLVGPACTAEDTLARDVPLPRAEPGDRIVIHNAGAYAARASITGFLGRGLARESVV